MGNETSQSQTYGGGKSTGYKLNSNNTNSTTTTNNNNNSKSINTPITKSLSKTPTDLSSGPSNGYSIIKSSNTSDNYNDKLSTPRSTEQDFIKQYII